MHIDMERSHDEYRNRHSQERYRLIHENHRRYSSRISPSRRSHSRSTSRNSQHYRNDNDYRSHSSSSSAHHSISSNRRNSGNNNQINYSNTHSPSSRYNRSAHNHRPTHSTYLNEQTILSNNILPSSSLSSYYNSSQPPSSLYIDSERNRYSSSSTSYRRDSPTFPTPPVSSSYRNDRIIDYDSRNNDFYMRTEYRPATPPPQQLTSLSGRAQPYVDSYRSNDYTSRSERYDLLPNRTTSSSWDYPITTIRNADNLCMSREQYLPEKDYRTISSSSRDHEMPSLFIHRPNLKRSSSIYDNESIPSKRSMRR